MTILEICLLQAPALAEDFTNYIRGLAATMLKQYGPTLNTSRHQGWDFAVRDSINAVIAVCDRKYAPGAPQCEYVLNEEKLAKAAHDYGIRVATQWAHKLASKLGAVDGLEYSASTSGTYTFTCTKDGRSVVVRQIRVWKTSVQGKPFHQFPARIYVDGAFTTEAAFKRLFTTP